jgi:hypothetical protein
MDMVIDRNTINNIFLTPTRAVLHDTIARLLGDIITRIMTMAQRHNIITANPVVTSREINILRELLNNPIQAREVLRTTLYCIDRLESYVEANPTEATFFAELLRRIKSNGNQLNSMIQKIETFIAEYENREAREDRANRERIASARGPYIPNSPINTYVIDHIFSITGNLDANLTSIASIIIRQNQYVVQQMRAINLDVINVFGIDVNLDSFNRPETIEYLRLLLREIYTLLLPYTEYLREKSQEYLNRNDSTTPRIRTIMSYINDQSRLYDDNYRRIMIVLHNARLSQNAEVIAIARAAIAFETNVKASIVAEIEEAHNRRDISEQLRRSLFDNVDDINENEDTDSTSTSTYQKKYLKYKNKYLALKRDI